MKKFSGGAMLAFQIASLEVQEAKHQYIDREHLLIGLCSLGKALMFPEKFVLNTENRQIVQSEHEAIEDVLLTFAINTMLLRLQIREKLGEGNYKRTDRIIHRSPACKEVFSRAEKLAAPTENITCLHFFVALLEEPGENIKAIFQDAGVSPMNLRQHIFTLLFPQEKTPHTATDVSQKSGQPGKVSPSIQSSPIPTAETQTIPDGSSTQRPAIRIPENPVDQLTILKGFIHWESLKDDVLASAQGRDTLKEIHFSDRTAQKGEAILVLHGLADLREGGAHRRKGYNVRRLCRILDVLRTRREVIFNFLELIETLKHKVIVFRALLDISDPMEHEYKNLIQRFLGLPSAINEQDTLGEVLSRAPTALKGTERVMRALHNINSALSAELRELLGARKSSLGALLEALDMAEMRTISQSIGEEITLPLYIGLALYAIAETTQGKITIGTFLRTYLCKEVPLSALLGILNKNVLGGVYMRSNLMHPEILDFPMDLTGPELAIQEIIEAFEETIVKSRVILDHDNNIVLRGKDIGGIPGKILIDTQGNITIDSPIIIKERGKKRHIFLAPQNGSCKVVRGKVRDVRHHTVIPGPACNITYGTEIFLPNTRNSKLLKSSILSVIAPKGRVYGSPEPTRNELKAVNQLINRQKEAEPKKAGLIEGERPKPLKYQHLILLYVAKCALEKFHDRYMRDPQEYVNKVIHESKASQEFQSEVDQNIYQLLALIFRIASHFAHDKSGGWKKFWELFAVMIPEQLGKYIEIMSEFRHKTTFMLPVLEIQKELGEVYWNTARLMLIKGGHRLPPIPRATPPTGRYQEVLQTIEQEIQEEQ